ncbi:MAG: hypothetical protein ACXVRH_06520 [Thermoleophilaceae bacterium]
MAPRSWLSVTPEPERELPDALATLRHEGTPPEEAIERERRRIEQLILHGHQADWLAYLTEVLDAVEVSRDSHDPSVEHAREVAETVIANHHNLLLGLPGRAAELTADERRRLNGGLA